MHIILVIRKGPKIKFKNNYIYIFQLSCLWRVSNFGDNTVSFPSIFEQILHLSLETKQYPPTTNFTQGN